MKTLILGLGYVGTELAERLVRAGHSVVGVRRSAEGEQPLDARIEVREGDITKPDFWEELDGGFDWVVNCASSSRGGMEAYRAVFEGGARLLADWLAKHPPNRFVFTSSTSVYAQTDGSEVSEGSPAEGAGETGRILRAAEDAFQTSLTRPGQACVLRVAGIYGPDRGHLFLKYLRDEAQITGSPDRWLNQVHRDDVAGAIHHLLAADEVPAMVNVADDEPVGQGTFFQWLAARLGKPMPPVGETVKKRKRTATNKRVANRLLRDVVGYHLQYPTYREGYLAEMERLGLAISRSGS